MQTYFYNIAGGINKAASKTELGLDTKKLYWAEAKNIEILQNSGIVRQKGNTQLLALGSTERIIGIHPIKKDNTNNLLIATGGGNLYAYEAKNQTIIKLNKTISSNTKVNFTDFLDGVICSTKEDDLFYINNDPGYNLEDCNLKTPDGSNVKSDVVCVYSGRVWVGNESTLYYSALGKYNDFTTENDAGYINNFFTDTNRITALKCYKDYLAIYKENSVYLLSGTSEKDFKITPFADKGTLSSNGVCNVNNKQYFINQGVYSLEQAGLLSQIQLGNEITLNIKPEFEYFDKSRFEENLALHYESKNQIWFFIPYKNDPYFHSIWIYNYINDAWTKRVFPQDITTAILCNGIILTGDKDGKIYKEDFGNTFNGEAIEFLWKSPFLSAGDATVKKTIEEFYFILDEAYDNNFNFAVYKNYDDSYKDDEDDIYSNNSTNLIWYGNNLSENLNYNWKYDSEDGIENPITSVWAIGSNSIHKAEISESNYSVQLCVSGTSANQNMAIIGLEFKEVILDE